MVSVPPAVRDRALFEAGSCNPMLAENLGAGNFMAYDDVNVSLIPSNAGHVSYYANGPFANLGAMERHLPNAIKSPCLLRQPVADFKQYKYWEHGLSIDVEPSLFTPAQAAAIAKEAKRQGVMPRIYFPLSWVGQVVAALNAAGLRRGDVQLHSAHWTGVPHVCSGIAGTAWGTIDVDQTQYWDKVNNVSLDGNLCHPGSYGPWGQAPSPLPPVRAATGLAYYKVTFNANPAHGHNWQVERLPGGNFHGGTKKREFSAELQVDSVTGVARVKGMPFNSRPLGRVLGFFRRD